ncbi:[Fe-Fe] hydrogenase large subunit C-terminal domain-containing protein [Ruthenibacterium lactatiformans]|uniref:[Fe-Fe] hydrogenase large subunit C-terminal domain-containing protein n=1 Tax=Ruthenibacterium lactatiformans TaxID=1550024 RepID=UPI0019679C6A|nr:[Fe-Fe] hydrogenase large subunit C-terminal domain-containing protein [Ruthenibacterium lactatiformans]MBN3013365.1 PAS domain-containing protein [Ruthenibacterium lactatiformans]
MNKFLQLKKSNCKNCYKCIRNCPVKSIKFADGQANIIPDECILCGRCFVNCPQDAKQIRDDVPRVKEMIASGKKVIASVAPSFIAEFPLMDFAAMKSALLKLGFADAQETAIGATIVKTEYEKMIASGKHDVIISSCCHSVNALIQKYYPSVLPYLADVLSPMLAHCRVIKEENPGACAVFIGPCISKKEEAELYGECDVALTYEELEAWMNEAGVVPAGDSTEPDEGKRGRFFPIKGGIIKSMHTENTGFTYLAVDGVQNCIAAIKEIESGALKNCFIEMNACEGACINGPAISHHHKPLLSGEVKVVAFAGDDEFRVAMPIDTFKNIPYIGTHEKIPGEAAIKEILAKMGKTSPEQELNCGSCGYPTCREKAIAVYQGKADLSMCLPFLKEKAETFSGYVINNTPNAIFVLDENLCVQQINKAGCALFNLKTPSDILGSPIVRLVNPADYLGVMTSGVPIKEKKHYLAEYKKYVAETIVYDHEYHIVFSIMRDITSEEERQSERSELCNKTVAITNEVIEKQMRVVQEIASLLGETTAETKIALTQLKDALQK